MTQLVNKAVPGYKMQKCKKACLNRLKDTLWSQIIRIKI